MRPARLPGAVRVLLPLLLVGVPAADLVADWLLAREFGFFPVFVYAVAAFVLGAVVLRWAGPITLARAAKRLTQGQVPGRELLDGLLLVAGGMYLVFPGPVSDVVAIVLVTPGLRRGPRWLVARAFGLRRPPPEPSGPLDVEEYTMR